MRVLLLLLCFVASHVMADLTLDNYSDAVSGTGTCMCAGAADASKTPANCLAPCTWQPVAGYATEAQFAAATALSTLPSDSTKAVFLLKVVYPADRVGSGLGWIERDLGFSLGDLVTGSADGTVDYAILFGTKAHAVLAVTHAAVDSAVVMTSALKLSPLLTSSMSAGSTTTYQVNIGLSPGSIATEADAETLATVWQSALDGASVSGSFSAESTGMIALRDVPAADVAGASAIVGSQPEAAWLEPEPEYIADNYYANWAVQSDTPDAFPFTDVGLDGSGQVVGVADSGLDPMSCFFHDPAVAVNPSRGTTFSSTTHRKLVQYVAFADGVEGENAGHGTHVAGSVAGLSNSGDASDTKFNGIAPLAKIAFYDIGVAGAPSLTVPRSLANAMFPPAYSAGARIHTNSWGANANAYTLNAREVDAYSWAHQDFLILFAAGNSGRGGIATVGTPATAKNCLTVGAGTSPSASWADPNVAGGCGTAPCRTRIASFSSTGPTTDGRIKPEVYASGFMVQSASSQANPTTPHCTLAAKAGTSMATPVCAGAAALLRQYFTSGFYPTGVAQRDNEMIPMAALLKAVFVNSAVPMTTALPLEASGFGRADLDSSVVVGPTSSHGFYIGSGDFGNMRTLSTGESYDFSITVRPSPTDLRVTLVWMDPPATSNARVTLINDLDLLLVSPTGTVVHPNRRTTRDSVNTVEHIHLDASAGSPLVPGVWRVSVVGTAVRQGPQPFSVVAAGDFFRDSTLFPSASRGRAPQPVAAADNGVIIAPATAAGGTANLLIAGEGLEVDDATAVVLTCDGVSSALPTTIVDSSPSSIAVSVGISACSTGGTVSGRVIANAFASDLLPLAVIGSDPTAAAESVAPLCGSIKDASICTWTSYCEVRGSNCVDPNAKSGGGGGGGVAAAVIIVLIVLAGVGAAVFYHRNPMTRDRHRSIVSGWFSSPASGAGGSTAGAPKLPPHHTTTTTTSTTKSNSGTAPARNATSSWGRSQPVLMSDNPRTTQMRALPIPATASSSPAPSVPRRSRPPPPPRSTTAAGGTPNTAGVGSASGDSRAPPPLPARRKPGRVIPPPPSRR